LHRKIRVVQLGSPHGLYGAERWILALVKNLDSERVESSVAVIKDEENLALSLCSEAQRYGIPSQVFESYGRFNASAIRLLREYLVESNIDVLHTHGYKTDFIGLLAARSTKCKVITTPHGWTKQPDFKLRVYEMADRAAFPFFDAVVPLSEELYSGLSIIPGMSRKLTLIKNGVDLLEMDKADGIAEEMTDWKQNGAFIIGYVGRLTRGKGLDILLDAVARYGQPAWQVALVGEGEHLNELRSLARTLGLESRVAFLGYREDRIALLKGFDVFVLPSRSEGIPRCIMEAMAAGIPVVASDIPGCRHLVEDRKTGLLFQPDQPEQLAEAIKRVVDDHRLKESLVREANVFIHSRYSAARMAKEYQDLYIQITENHH